METADFSPWLKSFNDPALKERIWRLGLLTGLRAEKDGSFRPANFERGLVLDRIVAGRKPRTVLELGTGRGLGAFAMAAAARQHGVELSVTTVDLRPPGERLDYALEVDGRREVRHASCDEIWSAHLDAELRKRITPITGTTTRLLPELLAAGRSFEFIFIDAGHDLFSVAHDLAYSAALLAPGGAILMDDFAPLEDFGLGTCVALTHARRLFEHVELFPTEGLIFGGTVHPDAPRGMIFLASLRAPVRVKRWVLPFWRVAGALLERCYVPSAFPAEPKRGR